ncbi:MAG: hypothetical protein ABGZ23_02025 [Fuerstiella sp.]|nr:hypothetical protein [Fuerstiella sp.]
MTKPLDDAKTAEQALTEMFWALIVVGWTIAAFLAWFLPQSKPGAVLGRFSYPQFLTAVLLTLFLASALMTVLRPRPKRRTVAFRIAAVWIGGISALVVAEAGCSLLPVDDLTNPWLMWSDDTIENGIDGLVWERKAHLKWHGRSTGAMALKLGIPDPYAEIVTFQTDFEGFRNSRDLRRADLIFIGDSFTEAGNVAEEDSFAQRVAVEMGVTCRNLGRINYSPKEELIVLQKYGLRGQPRTVIWQICEHNDLPDQHDYDQWIARGAPPIPLNSSAVSGLQYRAWQLRSPTYRLFTSLRQQASWKFNAIFRDSDDMTHEILFGDIPTFQQCAAGHPGWPSLAATIREGAELLRDNDIHLIVVLIPMKIRAMVGPSTNFSDVTSWLLVKNVGHAREDTLAFFLRNLCDSLHVTLIDSTLELRERTAAGELVYFPLDAHLSPPGHAVVANQIAMTLRQHDSVVPD